MTIDPKDLPPEMRRAMLDHLRSQIGDSQYRELMDRADEDQVLAALLKQAQSPSSPPAKPSPPAWAVLVGKLVLIGLCVLGAWLIGTINPVGRAFVGIAAGLFFSVAIAQTGFAFGAVIGGAIGGAVSPKLDGAFGGAMIGGWAVVLIRVGLEWLAKQAASITRYR